MSNKAAEHHRKASEHSPQAARHHEGAAKQHEADITKRQRLTVRDTSFREELWALDNRARQSYLARQCIGRGA